MGSSGFGNFGTYDVDGNSSGSNMGGVTRDGCPEHIENVKLEDVATSDFFIEYNSLPANGSTVYLGSEIFNGRLVVKTEQEGLILGHLPTQYNHLITCIKQGIGYVGTVIATGEVPIPYVIVELNSD